MNISAHRKDDQNFNDKQLMARAAKVLLLDPDNTSWFEIVGEMEKMFNDKIVHVATIAVTDIDREYPNPGRNVYVNWNDDASETVSTGDKLYLRRGM